MAEHNSGIGRKIAYYRARKGLSQRDFAPLIKRSEAWVSQVERGVRPVKAIDVLERIADVLDMPVAELAPSAPTAQAERIPADAVPLRLLLTGNHALRATASEHALLATASGAGNEPDPERLERGADAAWTFTRLGRYTELLALLETLLPELEAAVVHADGSRRAEILLADTYQAYAVALTDLEQFDAAWVSADRAIAAAQRAADPILMAAGAFRLAFVFQRSHRLDQAKHAAGSARAVLGELVRGAEPRASSVYGALTLQLALIAARAEEAEQAYELLADARATATTLGADRDDHHTEFGPTAVDLHEVAAAVELGDAGTAIRLAGKIGRERLTPGQLGRLLIDTARAWAQRRSPDRALALLLEAEVLAPEQVYRRKSVRSTTADLLSMDRGAPGLGEFAQRIGMDAALIQPATVRPGPARSGLRAARGPRAI
ncbi:helix-turn-helix domain-containing protein [Nocardia sp. NBC_01329]|uniref:helix-turn-helix domain-containing protein n=1 Tax=Nocardia sp. NBC_01329 TaxID=2903594 RepID=UPI002E11FA8F|nr:helix-turn-helix domain-containing protein [Nocardia sp. NBC_01329]